MAEKEKKPEKRYEITEVATQTALVIRDNNTQEDLDLYTAVCNLLNDIQDLKKQLM